MEPGCALCLVLWDRLQRDTPAGEEGGSQISPIKKKEKGAITPRDEIRHGRRVSLPHVEVGVILFPVQDVEEGRQVVVPEVERGVVNSCGCARRGKAKHSR